MWKSNTLIATLASAVLLVPVVHAQKPQPSPASTPDPSRPPAPHDDRLRQRDSGHVGAYTFAEADGLREYRLDGKEISKFAAGAWK